MIVFLQYVCEVVQVVVLQIFFALVFLWLGVDRRDKKPKCSIITKHAYLTWTAQTDVESPWALVDMDR